MKRAILLLVILAGTCLSAQPVREKILINNDWTFCLGHGGDMMKDFTHGTEYFTYVTKVSSSAHSHAPSMPEFDDRSWQKVSLPHDWVVDLPYSGDASHSHGYKCVGWHWPENNVGWYRKHIFIPEQDRGKRISVIFEGVFRNSQVFCNGVYCGHELSGYATSTYDITDYLNFGGDNIIVVRCDASTEEGWFYEGAGIYRNVYLTKTAAVYVERVATRWDRIVVNPAPTDIENRVTSVIANRTLEPVTVDVVQWLCFDEGDGDEIVAATAPKKVSIEPWSEAKLEQIVVIDDNDYEHWWTLENPQLYHLLTVVMDKDGNTIDQMVTSIGLRTLEFNPDKGFFLNGKRVEIKGFDLHLDHAGVGTGVPDALWEYRINRIKSLGANAIRCSHNPASPAMLDLCDRMGMLVIDENRLMGTNGEHLELFRRMIERDINHPCVILWSVGNEEWAIEGSPKGRNIAREMTAFAHSVDPSRQTTYGNSGANELVKGVDVFGYNYIRQNHIEENHAEFPDHCAVGTEETTGCGTRGKSVTVPEKGWMAVLDAEATQRGWEYYRDRPWLGGLFYWTGFDYRGEPNPMVWPATGSQFGVLDYCGFEKIQAEYLRTVWGGPVQKAWSTTAMEIRASNEKIKADGQDVAIFDISVPAEEIPMTVSVKGPAEILGWGNGDPGFKEVERPAPGANKSAMDIASFSGKAQVILRSIDGQAGKVTINVKTEKWQASYSISTEL